MSPALQNALLGLAGVIFTGIGALAGSWYATRTTAKQSELDKLRERVDELTLENIKLHKQNIKMREYIFLLRLKLAEHDINMPAYEQWSVSAAMGKD